MIDYEMIGKRIQEERKILHKISQEKMAEDLGIYQADISNLEKAKKGSGITDLSRLEMIADYFGISLEALLFGRRDENMVKYYGKTMEIQPAHDSKMPEAHRKVLCTLMGVDSSKTPKGFIFKCGPYTIYVMMEKQYELGQNARIENDKVINPDFILNKPHTFIFYNMEIVAVMSAAFATVMDHVFQPHLRRLQEMIPHHILDVTDVWRTLNPYWALWMFTDESDPEHAEYEKKMVHRMDEIRQTGENRLVLYLESIYVREDFRRLGICRMYIDVMKILAKDCIIWLNMEPTAGEEMAQEYDYFPTYTVSDLGQISENAAIAEKLGFTIDPDFWHIRAEVLDDNGNTIEKTVEVRKCAYYLPQAIREIIKDDKDLVALGRAKQRIVQTKHGTSGSVHLDMKDGRIDDYAVMEVTERENGDASAGAPVYVYAAIKEGENVFQFGVSDKSIYKTGLNYSKQMERYDSLDDAEDSDYFDQIITAYQFLIAMQEEKEIEEDDETENAD